MELSFGVWLAVLGFVGASSLIMVHKPGSFLARVLPYQGWMGAASVVYGAWAFVAAAGNMELWRVKPPMGLLVWMLWLASGALLLALGLLLGVSVVRGLLRDEGARRRVDKAVARLAPVQLVLGLTAMGVGVVFTLMQMAV